MFTVAVDIVWVCPVLRVPMLRYGTITGHTAPKHVSWSLGWGSMMVHKYVRNVVRHIRHGFVVTFANYRESWTHLL